MAATRAPNRYHHPPAPTNPLSRTDGADALSAALTRFEYGGGTEKDTSSLEEY